MKINISDEAKPKLSVYFKDKDSVLLLDFNDGVGHFSTDAASCTLSEDFRILVISRSDDYHEYNKVISTNLGDLYYKDYSKTYMDEDMDIRVNSYNQLTLHGLYRGQLTSPLSVIDMRH